MATIHKPMQGSRGTLTRQTKGAVVGGAFWLRGNDRALLLLGGTKPRLAACGASADIELKQRLELSENITVTTFIAGG